MFCSPIMNDKETLLAHTLELMGLQHVFRSNGRMYNERQGTVLLVADGTPTVKVVVVTVKPVVDVLSHVKV